jgi:hypothetical protein
MQADVMAFESSKACARSDDISLRASYVARRRTAAVGYGFSFPCPVPGSDAADGPAALSPATFSGTGYSPQPRASLAAALAVSSGLVLGIGSLLTSLLMLTG